MKTEVRAFGDKVVILKELQSVVGGIELSGNAQKNFTLTVVDVGPDVPKDKLKIGDKIIAIPLNVHFFMGYAGLNRDMGIVAFDKIEAIIKEVK